MGGRIAAVVTGAGSGLGRSVAIGLAARGCDITIVDIDAGAGESARRDCEAKGVTAHFIEADLLASGAAARIVGRAIDLTGSIGILVNNAGYGAGEAFLDMKEATWDRTLGLNLRALAMMCSIAGREMARQKNGRIVNITSPASRMALPNYTAYSASKAGVDAVTRAAAAALAPHGVLVNSVSPGMMDTPMQRQTERQFARARKPLRRFRRLSRRAHEAHSDRPPPLDGGGRRQRHLAGARRARLHHRRTHQRVRRHG